MRSPRRQTVIKVGGSAGIDRAEVAKHVATRHKAGERIVLVHGASAETDRLQAILGHPVETIVSPSGHSSRRTDRRTMEIFAMAALGIENFLYVELLQKNGVDAVGLSGMSARLLVGKRKAVRAVRDGKTVLLRDDYTGTIESVNARFLLDLLDAGRVPVVAPIALSEEGDAVNVDGDRAAAKIAAELHSEQLDILTNVPGLLRDIEDRTSVEREVTLERAESLAQGRMKKKTLAAREAIAGGVGEVWIRSTASQGTRVIA